MPGNICHFCLCCYGKLNEYLHMKTLLLECAIHTPLHTFPVKLWTWWEPVTGAPEAVGRVIFEWHEALFPSGIYHGASTPIAPPADVELAKFRMIIVFITNVDWVRKVSDGIIGIRLCLVVSKLQASVPWKHGIVNSFLSNYMIKKFTLSVEMNCGGRIYSDNYLLWYRIRNYWTQLMRKSCGIVFAWFWSLYLSRYCKFYKKKTFSDETNKR